MDPGRRAMLSGQGSSGRKGDDRDITGPRPNSSNRVAKTTKGDQPSKTAQNVARYLTSDEQSRQFVADEDKFVLKQSKKKADIRVREGRAKPIDYLTFNLRYMEENRDTFDDQDGDLEIELKNPAAYIESLTRAQITELNGDIASFLTLEVDASNRQYWEALRTLCASRDFALDPVRKAEKDRAYGVNADVISENLKGHSTEGLDTYETRIRAALASDQFIDREFQSYVLDDVLFYKAKKVVEGMFRKMSESREKLLQEQGPASRSSAKSAVGVQPDATENAATVTGGQVAALSTNASAAGNEDASVQTQALYDREAAQGLLENEEVFTTEAAIPDRKKPEWTARYKARKPRYFNRVQMGYEWNKYNQTHFDHDNPPPKVVQGYRFNIFYPDLVDSTKTPTYKIFRDDGRKRGESLAKAGEEDTCLIIFIAGPPYEDIAFRIVDRQWDFSAKKERGFKSTFDRGILQLHFNFKKIFYRK
ncbi:hypothetical protein JDV02_009122 [Purpureocillium takamizusanense]|uniref:Splicing factor Cactin n=1 Tax=Purpureocillium takamizusanense TaxID=2060973 RepID=A0A9Q8QQ11_9HYPO|nr:uncharacterized protein JDV02_009122 [Purpureocillium takamizusanense]UNI23292.1 hypothetical protein JDV02_009122 [Purpureocillium takamizusanense]